jgi:hypothetical protein
MVTRTRTGFMRFAATKNSAVKQIALGALVLFLTIGAGDPCGTCEAARAMAQADTVIDRLPETTAAVVRDQGNSLFVNQILYAGIIAWVISLLVGRKN